ncbi:MAG: chromosome segregation protein SMC [Candidatus Nanoarchaeia archaeon]|nr:chromosome segregation protein SMC [Candidatus Nanoarchaeia archaeon]
MTRILKLELKGFKSFAEKTELVYGKTFNTVIGPNGSGKSNVMDAICFVLGKSSAKSMRVEKSSNLIYNGGKTKKPYPSAEVSIFFSNYEKEFPIDDDEIKVSRMVKQDGTSIYKINDKRSTRAEIVTLFSKAGIDPDGYNIILQGDIIRIIDMSPIERRKIVDEIAGISVYDDKKDKAMSELEKVENHLKETDVILAERKTHLDELKVERDEAEKFIQLDEKSKELKYSILQKEIQEILKSEEKNFKKKETLENKKEELQNKIKDMYQAIIDKKEEIKKINNEIDSKGTASESEINKRIEFLKVEIEKNKNRLEICQNEIIKIQDRDKSLETSTKEIGGKIELLKKEVSSLQLNQKRVEDSIFKNKEEIEEFNKKNNIKNVSDIEQEVDKLDEKIEIITNQINELRVSQQDLLREKDKIEIQINNFNENQERVNKIKDKNQEDFEKLKSIRQDFKEKTLKLNKIINEDSSISAQLNNARQTMISLEKDYSKAMAQQNIVSAHLAQDRAISHILKEKQRNQNIIGIVSELGNVKKQYSTALEVAAGGKLKNIVVQTDEDAKELISDLKRLKLGTATFLPINKIRASPIEVDKSILTTPGVIGRAYDLITFNKSLDVIFRHVFGNTIVVENLTVAQKVGIGRLRMVTIDGDVVEGTGAMRGGFRRESVGVGFSEKESNDNAQRIEKELSDTRLIISSLENKKQQIEEEILKLRQNKAELEGEIIKIEKSLHIEENFGLEEKDRKDLENKLEEIDEKIDEIVMQISGRNRELANLKIEKQDLRNKLTDIKDPKKLAELNALKTKEEQLKEELNNIQNRIKNNILQIENILSPELKNIEKIVLNQNKENIGFKKEIKELEISIDEMTKELNEKLKLSEDFLKKFKDLILHRTQLEEEIANLEKEKEDASEFLKVTELELNTLSINLASVKGRIAGFEEQINQLNIESKEKIEKIENEYKDSDLRELKKELNKIEGIIRNLGTVNLRALEVYDSIKEKFDQLIVKKDKLVVEKEEILIIMNEIETKKRYEFLKTYEVIQEKFKRLFGELLTKGEAYLELEDSNDPFAGGLLIKVKITGNKFLDIRSLSGGEKTMTALAFVFAIQEFNPASFYIMDEVDAALDKKNAEKLGQLVRKYSKNAQYIVISHNDGVIKQADYLFGVTMNQKENISKVVSLRV